MVAIKQNRRARHRLRGGNSSGSSLSSRDRALGSALLTIFSFCCFCSFFLWSNRQDPYSSTSSIFRRDSSGIHGLQQATQQLDPIRPNLHLYDVLGDNAESLNAVAKDILDTLDCHRLLNRTSEDYGWGGGGVSYKAEINRVGGKEGSIRRLTETEAIGEAGPVDDRRAFIEKDENPAKKADWSREEKNSPRNGYGREEGGFRMDDLYPPNSPVTPTASHLFCVAALWASSTDPSDHVSYWKDQIQCPATVSRALTAELIELFSTARSEMSNELLLKTLQATEKKRELVGTNLDLWAPPNDDGIGYMLGVVNQKDGEWRHMRDNLGPGKLFVDVGSYLGVSGMAVALLYPGTQIVSVEAAAPNWLLQQVNWRCNHHLLFGAAPAEAEEAFREGQVGDRSSSQSSSLPLLPKVLLSGVGPTGHASHIAKMMWRPTATTATRSWTPQKEIKTSDVEITVHIKAWHSILQESGIAGRKIDVLNVDCEGCEYNLIPAMSEEEFRAIATVLGTVHWGYIPMSKLPSSKRGKETHRRMCQHENVARTVKECCAFPDLPVKSSVPGETLVLGDEEEDGVEGDGRTNGLDSGGGRKAPSRLRFPPRAVTVRDVAGELCNDFEAWKAEKHLNDIDTDWGWFQLTSTAQDA